MTSMAWAAGPGAERRMRGRAAEELAAYRAAGGLLGLFLRDGMRPISDVLADRGVLGQRTMDRLHGEALAEQAAMTTNPAVQLGGELALAGADVSGPGTAQQEALVAEPARLLVVDAETVQVVAD